MTSQSSNSNSKTFVLQKRKAEALLRENEEEPGAPSGAPTERKRPDSIHNLLRRCPQESRTGRCEIEPELDQKHHEKFFHLRSSEDDSPSARSNGSGSSRRNSFSNLSNSSVISVLDEDSGDQLSRNFAASLVLRSDSSAGDAKAVDSEPAGHLGICPYGDACVLLDDTDHTHDYVHKARCLEFACAKLSDERHCREHLHLCAGGMACKISDKAHSEKFFHPDGHCTDLRACKFIGSSSEDARRHLCSTMHPCKDGVACKLLNDGLHKATFTHPCTVAGCANQDSAHVNQFTHACADADNCARRHNLQHEARFYHSAAEADPNACPNGARAVTITSLERVCEHILMLRFKMSHTCALSSKIQFAIHCSRRVSPARFSHFLCLVVYAHRMQVQLADGSTPQGVLQGRNVQGLKWTKRMVVLIEGRKYRLVPANKVTVLQKPVAVERQACADGVMCEFLNPMAEHPDRDEHMRTRSHPSLLADMKEAKASKPIDRNADAKTLSKQLNAPWHSCKRIWRSPFTKRFLLPVLQQQAPGLKVSYMDVFQRFFDAGFPIFVMGGTPRDALRGERKINDIDLGFGCSVDEAVALAKANGWPVWFNAKTGLVRIGAQIAGQIPIEGKPLRFLNNDNLDVANTPVSIGCDLTAESIYGDFCVNRLWFCPINDVIVDPTGFGVHDALFKLLRLPVGWEKREDWLLGNPMKSLRFFKFAARGYAASSRGLENFVIKRTRELFDANAAGTPEFFIKYLKKGREASEFRELLLAKLGVRFWRKHFNKWFQQYHGRAKK